MSSQPIRAPKKPIYKRLSTSLKKHPRSSYKDKEGSKKKSEKEEKEEKIRPDFRGMFWAIPNTRAKIIRASSSCNKTELQPHQEAKFIIK